ncbi:DNA-directed RNA polymerase, subunit E'' [Candidatus Woesearchaeota archaeon]|nr:DNA-directed RNA polymerase, subunit E'' [Candidatus Woesearchaeota archaeon]MBW3018198.1 DNA-directed RNA polymerase, subunit E'' [Candidatus Woesearchaeota archaeon]
MAKKVCKNCKMFVTGEVCPVCKKNQFTTTWRGRIIVLDPKKSEIAQKIGATAAGEYAIKIR